MCATLLAWSCTARQICCFNDTATTELYTLSLHDALPICRQDRRHLRRPGHRRVTADEVEHRGDPSHGETAPRARRDRKSTRLNSSHVERSYAVFRLKQNKRWFDSGR